MLKVPDAIICYSCSHYVLLFTKININSYCTLKEFHRTHALSKHTYMYATFSLMYHQYKLLFSKGQSLFQRNYDVMQTMTPDQSQGRDILDLNTSCDSFGMKIQD